MMPEREMVVLRTILKEMMKKGRVRITSSSEFQRELGNLCKRTGISTDELRGVLEPMVRDLVEEMFSRK